MNKYAEKAIMLHKGGYNCAQSVLCAFSDKLDVDEKVLFKISEGFGLGMGGMESTCGSISGAIMLAGLMNSSGSIKNITKGKTHTFSREIIRSFREKNGSIICNELKGIKTGEVLRSCSGCIEDSVEIVCDIFFSESCVLK